jgi:hypothetical protein
MDKLTVKSLLELMELKNVTLEIESDCTGECRDYIHQIILFEFNNFKELHDGLLKLEDYNYNNNFYIE